MAKPFIKLMKNEPRPTLIPGYIQDDYVLTQFQRENMMVLSKCLQFEEEAYMADHPEICAMLRRSVENAVLLNKILNRQQSLAFLGRQLTRPYEELDKDIRTILDLPPDGPYSTGHKAEKFVSNTTDLLNDLRRLQDKYTQVIFDKESTVSGHNTTQSSSFLSLVTSETTQATPEPTPIPSPTTSEIFYGLISKAVDKATFVGLGDYDILYDTAYVEIMKAVENAMELTVVQVKEDITALLNTAYRLFDVIIAEREQQIAERNWERRMRKKLKRTLRRQDNFKGYVTPPTPKSNVSSHESYKRPPPPPCACHPQFHYNRYAKDRFGIYLPREEQFCNENTTLTPVLSVTDLSQCKLASDNENQPQETPKPVEPTKTAAKPSTAPTKVDQKQGAKTDDTSLNKDKVDKPASSLIKPRPDEVKYKKDVHSTTPARTTFIDERSDDKSERKDFYTERLKMLTFVKREKVAETSAENEGLQSGSKSRVDLKSKGSLLSPSVHKKNKSKILSGER